MNALLLVLPAFAMDEPQPAERAQSEFLTDADIPRPRAEGRKDLHRMDPGDVELRFGLGTTPRVRGSGGVGLWALSWWGTEGSLDVGLLRAGPMALSVGVEGSYGRPWLLQTTINGAREYWLPQIPASVSAEHWGMGARLGVHVAPRPDGVIQPYVALAMGMRNLTLTAQHEGSLIQGVAQYRVRSVGVSPRLGVDLVFGPGFVLAWESGYTIGLASESGSTLGLSAMGIDIVSKEGGGTRDAPRGWTHGAKVGWRF
jgi:hypothetical protein